MAATTLRKVATSSNGSAPADTAVEMQAPTVMEPTLVAVPDIGIFHAYEGRSFGGTKTEMDIFDYARQNRVNVLIEGPTGDGKTMASMAYAAKNNLNFYSVPCNIGVDPSQLFGKWVMGNDGPEWVDGGLTCIVRNGGVLLINEGNAMPAKVAMVLFSLLDHRREITLLDHRGEVIKAHPDLLIIMDMNPGYAGTTQLNAALRNRFPIQLSWDYDPEVERKLIRSTCLREDIVAGLREQYRDGAIQTPTSTNMMIEFERMVRDLGLDFAIINFINHYSSHERGGVSLVFGTFRDNLVAEYAMMADQGPDNPNGDHLIFQDTNWIYVKPGEPGGEV